MRANQSAAAPAAGTKPSSSKLGSPARRQAHDARIPAGGAGGQPPAWASTKAPVPRVTFAVPGAQQRRPNNAAGWSPVAARTRTPPISASRASESATGGSSARGMPKSVSSSSSQSPDASPHSSERPALWASDTCCPARRCRSQQATSP